MVLDVHCHIVPPEMARDPAGFGRRDVHFGQMAMTKGARFNTGEELIRDMDKDGVDKAVAFGFAFKDMGVSRLQNDYALALARENPGKVAAMAVLDPEAPGALVEAERCLAAGACGFGELFPSGHGFSLIGEGMSRLAAENLPSQKAPQREKSRSLKEIWDTSTRSVLQDNSVIFFSMNFHL
jgi:hypothetical protein